MAKMRIKISKWEWLKMSHQKQMHFERQENDICNPLPSKKKKNQNCQPTSLYLEFWNNISRFKENYRWLQKK